MQKDRELGFAARSLYRFLRVHILHLAPRTLAVVSRDNFTQLPSHARDSSEGFAEAWLWAKRQQVVLFTTVTMSLVPPDPSQQFAHILRYV